MMPEQCQDVLRESSRFGVASKTITRTGEGKNKVRVRLFGRGIETGGEGERTLVLNFSRAMMSGAGRSLGRKS